MKLPTLPPPTNASWYAGYRAARRGWARGPLADNMPDGMIPADWLKGWDVGDKHRREIEAREGKPCRNRPATSAAN